MVDTTDQGADYGSILRLTTLSPVLPGRLGALRRRLAFVAWAPGVGRPLFDLMTIHCARWIIFDSLPHPDGSNRRWPLNWNYLLFAATYDGPRDAYLNTFADVLPLRLSALFGDCFGFGSRVIAAPGAEDRVFAAYAFRDFVTQNEIGELGSHSYVNAPVRTILQALAINRRVRRSDPLSGPTLEEVQSQVTAMALGPPSNEPGFTSAVLAQARRAAARGHTTNPLTIVAPLWSGQPEMFSWPLAGLPDTLFARVVSLPRAMQGHLGQKHPDHLPVAYMLFASDYYGQLRDYVEALRRSPDITKIFDRCIGFPGTADRHGFRDWVHNHSVKTQYYLSGYPAPPVEQLQGLLAARAGIARWSLGQLDPVRPVGS